MGSDGWPEMWGQRFRSGLHPFGSALVVEFMRSILGSTVSNHPSGVTDDHDSLRAWFKTRVPGVVFRDALLSSDRP